MTRLTSASCMRNIAIWVSAARAFFLTADICSSFLSNRALSGSAMLLFLIEGANVVKIFLFSSSSSSPFSIKIFHPQCLLTLHVVNSRLDLSTKCLFYFFFNEVHTSCFLPCLHFTPLHGDSFNLSRFLMLTTELKMNAIVSPNVTFFEYANHVGV